MRRTREIPSTHIQHGDGDQYMPIYDVGCQNTRYTRRGHTTIHTSIRIDDIGMFCNVGRNGVDANIRKEIIQHVYRRSFEEIIGIQSRFVSRSRYRGTRLRPTDLSRSPRNR
eukprot:Pompholyxophrys_punicea_v1_NODE_162_length_3055_cov_4.636000.p6 type:complete len:112 gc:universal NODE_162_length_3055_cov_4.636000:986-1321(+)